MTESPIPLKEASKRKRLLNFVVDFFIIGTLISWLGELSEMSAVFYYIAYTLIFFLAIGGYWIMMEYFLGKTVGKYVTRTKVIFKPGVQPEFRRIVIRTWSRFIPFEVVSLAMGKDAKAWHDVLSGTMVVED